MDDPFAGAIPASPAGTSTAAPTGDDPFAGAIPGNTPAEQAGPPQQQFGFSDIPGQLWQGVRHGIGDVGQTFGAEGMESAPGAAPYEWSDILHPGSALAKTAYRLGEGAPTLGAGIAGGAAGTGLAGPVGGIAGGALGAAGMSALQTLGPAFARELKDNPGDPDAAWSRAVKSAVTSGAFSGAAWAAFPMRFFEGPIKNAAFQIFGVQPTLAAGHQTMENIEHGRAPFEGVGEAYTEGAVGTALPMAARAAVGRITGDNAARTAAAKATSGEPPTAEELENIANQHYGDIEHRNIRYTNIDELEAVQRNIRDMLYKAGADPRTEKRVFDAVDSLAESRRGPGAVPDWSDIEHARKMLNNAMSDRDPATRRAAALAIHDERNGLDAWIENPQAQVRAGVDPVLAHDLADKAALARSYWRASKGMEAFDRIVEKANNSSNAREVTFRNEIRKVVNDPRKHWQYPPEAIALMREGLHRGFWQAAAHASKLFDPHSSFGLFTNFMSHNMFGPEGLLAMPAAMALRAIGQRPLKRVEQNVPRMIAEQATGPLPKRPRFKLTKAGYTPYAGPLVPQVHAQGGAVGKALQLARRADGGEVSALDDRPAATGDDIARAMTPPPNMWQQWTDPINRKSGEVGDIIGGTAQILGSPLINLSQRMGEAYESGIPWDDPEQMKQTVGGSTVDLLSLATPEIPFARPSSTTTRAFFATEPHQYPKIDALARQGASPEDIWSTTRNFQDAAGNWRTERLGPTEMRVNPKTAQDTILGRALDAPHLFDPMAGGQRMLNMPLKISSAGPKGEASTVFGSYYPSQQNIWLRRAHPEAANTLHHEIQHGIDDPAGFLLSGYGGDPNWMKKGYALRDTATPSQDPIWLHFQDELAKTGDPRQAKQAAEYLRYHNSIDEVMARLAARRQGDYDMLHGLAGPEAAESYASQFPLRYQDVPRHQQLYRRGGAIGRALSVAKRGNGTYIN